MPAALIASSDRPKNFISKYPVLERRPLVTKDVSPHRRFSVPSRCQVQWPAAHTSALRSARLPWLASGFSAFRHVSDAQGGMKRCSSATGAQQNAECLNYDVVSISYICQRRRREDLIWRTWRQFGRICQCLCLLRGRYSGGDLPIRTIRSGRRAVLSGIGAILPSE